MQLTTLFILMMQMHCQNGDAIYNMRGECQEDKVIPHIASQMEKPKVLQMETTAYSGREKSHKSHKKTGEPAKKKKASIRFKAPSKDEPGTIATDPRVIPKGTLMYVENYGLGIAEDRGLAIIGNKLDLYMGTGKIGHKLACTWGRKKNTKVLVIGKL